MKIQDHYEFPECDPRRLPSSSDRKDGARWTDLRSRYSGGRIVGSPAGFYFARSVEYSPGVYINALTGTPLARLRKKECWLDFGRSLSEGETVVASAERCGVALSTAFRWRHRFLSSQAPSPTLTGIVEADETFVLLSYKGSRAWERAEQGLPGAEVTDREARGRGGKATKRGLSHEQGPILVAADRSGAVVSAVLPVDSAEAIKAVLDPVLSKDA